MSMTPKEALHRLVDELPDSQLDAAERILKALGSGGDPLDDLLEKAPLDDEPDLDDEDGGLTQARSETSVSHREARRRLLSE